MFREDRDQSDTPTCGLSCSAHGPRQGPRQSLPQTQHPNISNTIAHVEARAVYATQTRAVAISTKFRAARASQSMRPTCSRLRPVVLSRGRMSRTAMYEARRVQMLRPFRLRAVFSSAERDGVNETSDSYEGPVVDPVYALRVSWFIPIRPWRARPE